MLNVIRTSIKLTKAIFHSSGNSLNNRVANPAVPMNWAKVIADFAMNSLLARLISWITIAQSLYIVNPAFRLTLGNATTDIGISQVKYDLNRNRKRSEVRMGKAVARKESPQEIFGILVSEDGPEITPRQMHIHPMTRKIQQAAENGAGNEAVDKSDSGGWTSFKTGKNRAKKQPGKLPPRPADPTKDSREAAADILREMNRRR